MLEICQNPRGCRKVAVKKVTATCSDGTTDIARLCAYCVDSVKAPGCTITVE